ncbi:type IVB secretion system protein IcmH/DotU [Xylophilus sp. GOD-11R]|uniref:type IVB secretion system protein IcmH/DotU n=1 Tax=Xylophilus sp. GOD-11R TaxID=3089814 RepID=UPI00298C35D0|nr:type IVB secretion system protein IcmH/DotU [Xylophilus sp. GOD-11R]WPB55356.1 type IVB secretion system protein IcmH/DotU [Xylophilus sp. GOD-11R]
MLLRALADIGCAVPRHLPATGVSALHELLTRELHIFTRLCERANLRRDHMLAVRFSLCTALDEAANLHTWGGGSGAALGPWSGRSLLHAFHQEGNGGEKVFLLIGRLAAQPDEHVDVLEVLHHIASLGFEGPYRLDPDGRRKHDGIRHRLHTLVAERRPPVPHELSPHWRGVSRRRFRLPRRVPVWCSLLLGTVAALGYFVSLQRDLQHRTDTVVDRLDEIAALRAPERRPVRLVELLKDDVSAGRVAVVDAPDGTSTVTFAGDAMFAPGQARLAAKALAPVSRVAEEIARLAAQQPLSVTVTGHSDNLAIATPQFADNAALSRARAQSVAQALAPALKGAPVTVQVEGAGDARPVGDNATWPGRAANRRVELQVRAGR